MEQQFRIAINQINRLGYTDIAGRLGRQLERITADTYKIAVVGEFKAGKTTLINRLFLKEDILYTDVLEATAVPTQIRYGPEKMLEVIPHGDGDETVRDKYLRIANPNPDQIRQYTSGSSSRQRAQLARTIETVRLWWPAPCLAGLTVFDTPGINSLNEAIIATTYRVIPESDVVLFITSARQLSSVELEFLTGSVFRTGITRMFIMIAYDPNAGFLTNRQQEHLIATIRSQLANIGHETIPVEWVNIRQLPQSGTEPGDTGFKDRVNKVPDKKDKTDRATVPPVKRVVDTVIGGLLGEHPSADVPGVSPEDWVDYGQANDAVEEKLITFIRHNVRPGRVERGTKVLNHQLRLAMMRCETELSAMEQTDAQRRRLLEELETKQARIQQQQSEIADKLRMDLDLIKNRFTTRLTEGLDQIGSEFATGFDACPGIGEIQQRIHDAPTILKPQMERLFSRATAEFEKEITTLTRNYQLRNQQLFQPLPMETCQNLDIDGGFLANVPPLAVTALDVSMFLLVGPFRPLARVLIRLIANEIPLLNRILPVAVAASVLRSKVKKSIGEQFQKLNQDAASQIAESIRIMENELIGQWRRHGDEQLSSVRKGLEQSIDASPDPHRRRLLEQVHGELAALMDSCGE